MTIYDVGEPALLQNQFYSDAAETILADPTTVVLTIRDPAGVVLTPAVVHPSLGTYTYLWTPLVRGMHEIRWVGSGAVAAVEQYGLNIRGGFPSTTDLVDVQTVRARLRMPKVEDDQDPVLEQLISSASAHIIDAYQHEFAPATSVATARVFAYRGGGILDLAPYNAQSGTITTTVVDTDGATSNTLTQYTDWQASPTPSQWGVVNYLRLPTLSPYVFTQFPAYDVGHLAWRQVTVTAKWGYATVPAPVQEAAILTVMDWYRRDSSRPAFTPQEDLDDGASRDVAIPQRARWLLRGFENRSTFA